MKTMTLWNPKQALHALLLGGLLLCATSIAVAQEPIPWNSLSPEQQQFLQQAQPKWEQMPADKQQRLLRGADRWSKMSDEERAQAKRRMDHWKSLPPEQRKALRDKARRFRELPPEQRQRLRGLRDDFRSLPKETQQQFRDCQKRKHDGEALDCRSLWPPALREKYADLPDPPSRHKKGPHQDRPPPH